MIRSSVYHLLQTVPPPSRFLAQTVAKPAAVVLSSRAFASANPKKHKRAKPDYLAKKAPQANTNDADVTVSKPSFAEEVWRRDPFDTPFFRRGFDDFFGGNQLSDPFDLLRHRRDPLERWMPVLNTSPDPKTTSLLSLSSPGYEIKEGPKTWEIVMDIPEFVKASDLKLELEPEGRHLRVTGEREETEEGVVRTTRFEKHFSIGPNVDATQLRANFDDGVLIVQAPKLEETKPAVQTIAITNKPHETMSDEEVRNKTFNDAFDESDWAESGKEALEPELGAKAKM